MTRKNHSAAKTSIAATTAALTTGVYFLAAASAATAEQGVIARGFQVDYGETQNRAVSGPVGAANFSLNDLCAQTAQVGTALQDIVRGVERAMTNAGAPVSLTMVEGLPGAPNRIDVEDDLATAAEQFCSNDISSESSQAFVISYSSCRMVMSGPNEAMTIYMPPATNEAYMRSYDHSTREVMFMNLTSQMSAAAEIIGGGWTQVETDYSPTGANANHSGYATAEYKFSHTGGLGETGTGALDSADVSSGAVSSPQQLGNLVSVNSSGTAWISASAPGNEIVESFYQNLINTVDANQNNSFFSGMIKSQIGMLSKGMPMVVEESTTSTVMGRTMGGSKSKTVITGIGLVDLASDWCGERPLPEGYTVTDVNQQMSEAMSGANGNSSADMASAMQQYQQAMEQLTPEQKAMMGQFGLGGGDMPGTTGAPASAAPAVASSSGRSGAASSDLTSDDLLESVQKHLDALGYDAGNTSGESSVMTAIAISQFQSEKGLPVTGEVSPQLLGVLSAEVDR